MMNGMKWLNPKIKTVRYWMHFAIIALVALGGIQLFQGGDMLTFKNIIVSVPFLALGDNVAYILIREN